MTPSQLDYRWNLRQIMASHEMFATTDLLGPLEKRGIRLSSSQIYRLVVDRPERLSLKILMALLDIFGCEMTELIEPVATSPARRSARAGGCGLVEKLLLVAGRVPIDDNAMTGTTVTYRDLWLRIRDALPKKGRRQHQDGNGSAARR